MSEGRQRARELREEMSRTEAGFLAQEARVDRLQLSYEAACAKFAEAAKLDPDNVAIWGELGDLWIVRGSLDEAGRAFSSARDAAARSHDDRDLSVAFNKIGDVRQAQGDLDGALASYQASHAIFERLAKADPGNAGWQRDLSVSHDNIGDLQQAQGDLAAALASYQTSLVIAERLAKADPGNARWQRDLAISYSRVARIEMKQGRRDDALKALRQGREIILQILQRLPDNPRLRSDLTWFESQIGS